MPSAIDDIRAAVKAAAGQTGEQAAPPAEAEKPKAEAKPKKPKKPKAEAKAAGLKKYRVSLVHNPELVVEAEDRLDAIEKYNAAFGIIATIHKHKVVPVRDAAPAADDEGDDDEE